MIIKGDFWQIFYNYDAICCTCNEVLMWRDKPYPHHELVMGAGIALQFKQKFPELPEIWGNKLNQLEKRYGHKPLMMITHPGSLCKLPDIPREKLFPYLIYFKTKNHWKDKSPIELIARSMAELCDYIDLFEWDKVLLPMPGVTNGGQSFEDVYKILEPYLNHYKEIDIIMKE